ncbi:SMI1/KNR4 family protein [Microbulbifer pacificus]|uniref:SMI1/KNR4 family protein n=1 Tax=Microbulbifer pacificus TaxID=407164 RepID=UPI000CF4118D|nr:SMI1/KNR4 family protein [Microbulbifer pacificus]
MNQRDIQLIEERLGVDLPSEYVDFLLSDRDLDVIDDVTLIDDASLIVTSTMAYRNGSWNQQWPKNLVYVGDEADACPFVLNCVTGNLSRLDHGSLDRKALETYASMQDFITARYLQFREKAEAADGDPLTGFSKIKSDFLFNLKFYTPVIIALIVIFLLFPAVAISIRELYRWVVA